MLNEKLKGKRIGFAVTGSFCTFDVAIDCMEALAESGAIITAILSESASQLDTKFGSALSLTEKIEHITERKIITTIPAAEPIGPQRLLDALVVLPATGNTIAKMTMGIADTPASFAVKSHLRNGKPVIIGISSNDALGTGAKNIGHLLNAKNIYFVPFGQDDCKAKPRSIVFKKEYVIPAICEALEGRQLQPILAADEKQF